MKRGTRRRRKRRTKRGSKERSTQNVRERIQKENRVEDDRNAANFDAFEFFDGADFRRWIAATSSAATETDESRRRAEKK